MLRLGCRLPPLSKFLATRLIGGPVWSNYPQTSVAPLQWRSFATNVPHFGAHGCRNRFKNTLK